MLQIDVDVDDDKTAPGRILTMPPFLMIEMKVFYIADVI